jgi:hypothetical protein
VQADSLSHSGSHLDPEPATHPNPSISKRKQSAPLPPFLHDPTVSDLTPSLDPERPNDSIAIRVRNIRYRYLNWSYNWGPANLWEVEFCRMLQDARAAQEVDEFFEELEEHTRKGRNILKELRYAGGGTCVGEYGVFIDLFVQGLDMAVEIASEVKFFEVKLDEFAPVIPDVVVSTTRYISVE